MKKIIALYAVFFYIGFLYANPMKDPKAAILLKKVSERIQSYKTLKIAFTLNMETINNKIRITAKKQGIFGLKGLKYYVSLKDQEIFSDGKTMWLYDKNANEVQITQPESEKNNHTITPEKLFTDFTFYEREFNYKLNKDKVFNKRTYHEIELIPIDKTKPFFKVLLYVRTNYTIYKIVVMDKSASKYTYTIQHMTVNKEMKDDVFTFKAEKHKNIEIIDLR